MGGDFILLAGLLEPVFAAETGSLPVKYSTVQASYR